VINRFFLNKIENTFTYLSKLTARDRLISRVIFLWILADTPVTRRGNILPVSVVKRVRTSGFL